MCVQPVDVFGNVRMANAKEEKRSMPTLASMPPDPVDEHPLMGAEVSPHERSQTYYDQVVLCGWCCDNFISMITDFVDGHSAVLPAAEGFDVLLNMMEHCKNISGIMELAEEARVLCTSPPDRSSGRSIRMCITQLIGMKVNLILQFLSSDREAVVAGL
uniref:Uncharacterized protein n=1 Tax=Parascaris equorum TaxID=6256 RepID=A0A914S997_PAREQ